MGTPVEVEQQTAEEQAAAEQVAAEQVVQVWVNVGPQGRIVIPAALRREWGLEQGQTLIARLVGGQLILERPATILARIKHRFAHLVGGPSLADELIAERRLEAARENEESV